MYQKKRIYTYSHNFLVAHLVILMVLGVITPIRSVQANQATSTASVLLLDTSGSMDEEDITGYTKIDAARKASNAILDVILTEKEATSTYQHEAGLISFDDYATTHAALTQDLASLQTTIDGLYADGSTAMADGFSDAIDMLSPVDPSFSKMVILLSDGLPNVGLGGVRGLDEDEVIQEVLNLARRAGTNNICVHTIGLGLPQGSSSGYSMNEDLLRQIASESGCGNYYDAQTAADLANVFVEIRHASLGEILFSQKGEISQDEDLDLGSVPVEQNQEIILFTLNWPGSKLKLNVTDPAGITVDESYPNASWSSTNYIESLVVTNPAVGNWAIRILGLDVPEGLTDYNMLMSARIGLATPVPTATSVPTATPEPTPTPQQAIAPRRTTDSGFLFLLVALALGGIGFGFYAAANKKSQKSSSQAVLIGSSGAIQGQRLSLSKNVVLGRGSEANIHLLSANISRSHAQMFLSDGNWYIKDLNSRLGTFVNGRAVTTAKLFSGDRIQIGEYVWTFMINK